MDAETLKLYVSYNPETGVFTKLRKTHARDNQKPVGSVLGRTRKRGYTVFNLLGKRYYAHRLAWLYMTGEFPPEDTDHIDGNRTNNKWGNLRIASRSQNIHNRTVVKSKTGFVGVYATTDKCGTIRGYVAQCNKRHLGFFKTPEEAAAAYDSYVVSTRGEFAKPNSEIGGDNG